MEVNIQPYTGALDGSTIIESSTTRKVGNVPNRPLELLAVGKRALENWNEDEFRIRWIKKDGFANLLAEFEEYLTSGLTAGATRRQVTRELRNANKTIDKAISDLKRLMVNKYGSDYKAHLQHVGIRLMGGKYSFPKNQQERKVALEMVCRYVENNPGLTSAELTLAYWQELLAEYNRCLNLAVDTDNTVTDSSMMKGQYKETIVRTLNALILIIKANYPDTYIQEIRKWGFHKEKY